MKKLMKKSSLLLAFALVFAGGMGQHISAVEGQDGQVFYYPYKTSATEKLRSLIDDTKEEIKLMTKERESGFKNIESFNQFKKSVLSFIENAGHIYEAAGFLSADNDTYKEALSILQEASKPIKDLVVRYVGEFLDKKQNSSIATDVKAAIGRFTELNDNNEMNDFFKFIEEKRENLKQSIINNMENDDDVQLARDFSALGDIKELWVHIGSGVYELFVDNNPFDKALSKVEPLAAKTIEIN